jgi:glycosyltransferase 2 family protein
MDLEKSVNTPGNSPSPNKSRSGIRIPPLVQNLLKFAIGGTAIWLLIHSGALNPALIGQAITRHPGLCLAGLFSYVFVVVLPAFLRWFLLINLSGLKAPASRIFSLGMIGVFFNSLIPGGTGGDLIKGYYLYREHADKDKALALTSIAMDRLVGLYALLCVAMIMTAANFNLWVDDPKLKLNSLFYAVVFLIFTGSIVFFFSPLSSRLLKHPGFFRLPGGGFLKSLFDSLLIYRKRPGGLFLALGLGIIVDCGLILLYYFFALALGLKLPLWVHGFVVPTLTMINGIPISPSGLGVGEAAGEVIYRSLGVMEGGSEVMALVHICVMAFSLIGAPFYFLYRMPSRGQI